MYGKVLPEQLRDSHRTLHIAFVHVPLGTSQQLQKISINISQKEQKTDKSENCKFPYLNIITRDRVEFIVVRKLPWDIHQEHRSDIGPEIRRKRASILVDRCRTAAQVVDLKILGKLEENLIQR